MKTAKEWLKAGEKAFNSRIYFPELAEGFIKQIQEDAVRLRNHSKCRRAKVKRKNLEKALHIHNGPDEEFYAYVRHLLKLAQGKAQHSDDFEVAAALLSIQDEQMEDLLNDTGAVQEHDEIMREIGQ